MLFGGKRQHYDLTMNNQPTEQSRRVWRFALIVLVVIPFLPELAVLATSALASIAGCHVGDKAACAVGPLSPSVMIATALNAGNFVSIGFGVAALWLALCFVAISFGWAAMPCRLLLAAAVAIFFALLPYIAPALAIGALANPDCHPNEGGVGPCVTYGSDLDGAAHDAVAAIWLLALGAPIAFGSFAIYAIALIVIRALASRRVF